ncbi:MAG: homocysteine S-methyltransferase family protein [Clostridia bacterium]|nr:homocysteine S-methyltransferase family protein [Clostridia bacterium]
MKITDFIKKNVVILDGGMGTLLQAKGLMPGELPETWNIIHPDIVSDIHKQYLDAGSNVISTNTFGANRLKFSSEELEAIIAAAVENARRAVESCEDNRPRWVALDIGPTGKMLKPLGDLDFEDAVSVFAEIVRLGVRSGVDLIFIETMSDSYETKAALLAAKENSSLPVFVSNAYGEDGKLMTGATPAAMVALLEGMGADAIGVNCSLGPKALMPVVEEYLKYSSTPLILKPNAGLPSVLNGETVYSLSAEQFAKEVSLAVSLGVNIIGGCCGTTPEYIAALKEKTKDVIPKPIEKKKIKLVSSYTRAVAFGQRPVLIGERINPTGKPRFREALLRWDIDYLLREAIGEEDAGADILDVNVGVPGICEAELLPQVISRIQEVTDLPLQIDTADPVAMERALRLYNGKPMINSVNGKAESMAAIFPLVKKYGGAVVCLTLDEKGIPKTAEERLAIAQKILVEADKYGIGPENLIFDTLAMAVSADKNAAKETLSGIKLISDTMSCDTILGISNVSFGLPNRDMLNASFFTLALANGLTAAIINPHSTPIMEAYRSYLALSGLDYNFEGFISLATKQEKAEDIAVIDLKRAIIKGLRDRARAITTELIKSKSSLDIINENIIPALDEVGVGYEKRKIFLPGLLMSAEAAGAAFEVIKSVAGADDKATKCTVVLATVKGDIHDIGKNIIKLILENYGFAVVDLGKDVSPEDILSEVLRLDAKIVGLSALMTTTLPAMEETVRLIRESAPSCRIMVGGAVLNEEYAAQIGADFYGRDAMEAVRFAEEVNQT